MSGLGVQAPPPFSRLPAGSGVPGFSPLTSRPPIVPALGEGMTTRFPAGWSLPGPPAVNAGRFAATAGAVLEAARGVAALLAVSVFEAGALAVAGVVVLGSLPGIIIYKSGLGQRFADWLVNPAVPMPAPAWAPEAPDPEDSRVYRYRLPSDGSASRHSLPPSESDPDLRISDGAPEEAVPVGDPSVEEDGVSDPSGSDAIFAPGTENAAVYVLTTGLMRLDRKKLSRVARGKDRQFADALRRAASEYERLLERYEDKADLPDCYRGPDSSACMAGDAVNRLPASERGGFSQNDLTAALTECLGNPTVHGGWEATPALSEEYGRYADEVRKLFDEIWRRFESEGSKRPGADAKMVMNGVMGRVLGDPEWRAAFLRHGLTEGAVRDFVTRSFFAARGAAASVPVPVPAPPPSAAREPLREPPPPRDKKQATEAPPYEAVAKIVRGAVESGRTTRQALMKETGYGSSMIDQVLTGRVNIPAEKIPVFARLAGCPEKRLRELVESLRVRLPEGKRDALRREIGRRLREERERRGRTRPEIERRLGWPQGLLSNAEVGRQLPPERFDTLLKALGFSGEGERELKEMYLRARGSRVAEDMPRPHASLGEYIRSLRLNAGLDRHEMASRLGIDYALYCAIESGSQLYPEGRIPVLSKLSGVAEGELRRAVGGFRRDRFRSDVPHPFEEVGGMITRAMEAKGMDRDATATRLGISGPRLSSMRSGTANVPLKRVDRFEEVLGIRRGKLKRAVLAVAERGADK